MGFVVQHDPATWRYRAWPANVPFRLVRSFALRLAAFPRSALSYPRPSSVYPLYLLQFIVYPLNVR